MIAWGEHQQHYTIMYFVRFLFLFNLRSAAIRSAPKIRHAGIQHNTPCKSILHLFARNTFVYKCFPSGGGGVKRSWSARRNIGFRRDRDTPLTCATVSELFFTAPSKMR